MRILLADDDHSVRRVIQFKLEKNGFDVVAVEDGAKALEALKSDKFDLLLADIRMPGLDGLQLLEKSKEVQPGLKVILITAHGGVSQAVQAVKQGAFDYLIKPFEDEELLIAIEKALAFKKLELENLRLKGQIDRDRKDRQMVGISPPFKKMMMLINKIAATDATILLIGESGTGKELVARLVLEKSLRADHEFIAINCAAIPRDLLESELFGHVKGAFTGAVRDKKGKFELANGGTLFLDEVSELAIDLQAKLLRVLQEKTVEPVGSESSREIDIRLIAATNTNLKERVSQGRFREDLFYRLNVIPISLPTLRERKEDIPILVNEFLTRFGGGTDLTVTPQLMARLTEYSWPGNIRELENMIERMVVLRKTNNLDIDDFPDDLQKTATFSEPLIKKDDENHLTFREAETKLIIEALEKCGWNRTKTARYLNMPRHILIYRLKKYHISEK